MENERQDWIDNSEKMEKLRELVDAYDDVCHMAFAVPHIGFMEQLDIGQMGRLVEIKKLACSLKELDMKEQKEYLNKLYESGQLKRTGKTAT